MWRRFNLRARIFLVVFLLMLITIGGGLISLWYTHRMNRLVMSMIDVDVVALRAAQEMQNTLMMQKGSVTYYFLDGNLDWIHQLQGSHLAFIGWLKMARDTAYTEAETEILSQIESEYAHYNAARNEVVEYYQSGEREKGYRLHQEIRGQFFHIQALCEEYKRAHDFHIVQSRDSIRSQARFVQTLSLAAMPTAIILGMLLAYILLKQVLEPIRQLALEADFTDNRARGADEVRALSDRVHSLIEDVDRTHTQLEQSREHLLQSEKWAMVGKLAAGVAHSIRNPLTSVKMRMFSMERTLELSETQKEDFDVISEEIRHIDNIVRNFLEFSRPPKLKMQQVSPSEVVDGSLQLLRHRLESYGVDVEIHRQQRLPEISADPEQLKEVMVNLLVNACETMAGGGSIVIQEEEGTAEPLGKVAVIRVRDNGPGIPQSVQGQVFQPFFSTKEEGTGLGLSIAARIVEDHGGRLDLESKEGEGATFIITLPFKEEKTWQVS